MDVAGETPAAAPGAVTDETTVHDDVELERTIGIGPMIGTGFFVFPGLPAANAGPAATRSFASSVAAPFPVIPFTPRPRPRSVGSIG